MYPRVEYYHDGDDPGEPLYLTPLIESGDLQKVSCVMAPPKKNPLVMLPIKLQPTNIDVINTYYHFFS